MKKTLAALLLTLLFNSFAQFNEKSLVAYFPFSGNAKDYSKNGFIGTIHGTNLTTDRFGNKKSAFYFDGENDYIDLSRYASLLNFKEPATISFWVKSDLDAPQAIFSVSDSTDNVYGIFSIFIGNNTTSTMNDELVSCANRRNASDDYITGYTTTNRAMLFDNN
jgi:hypothetical protein